MICVKWTFYKSTTRNVKENGSWKEVQVYMVDEKMQILGHGSKSVIVAQQFIKLYFPRDSGNLISYGASKMMIRLTLEQFLMFTRL